MSRWYVLAALGAALLLPRGAAAQECASSKGDVTQDSKFDILDVQCAIVTALWATDPQAFPTPPCLSAPAAVADQDCDEEIQVGDIQLVVAHALKWKLAAAVDANQDGCADACEFDVSGGGPGVAPCFGGGLGGVACADGNPCTLDLCKPHATLGGCLHLYRVNGYPCDADGDGCTRFDSCQLGSCTSGDAPNCDDETDCTTDSCVSTGATTFQCVHTAPSGPCSWEEPVYVDGDDTMPNFPLASSCQHGFTTAVAPDLECDGECGVACDTAYKMRYTLATTVGRQYRVTVKLADASHDCGKGPGINVSVTGNLGVGWSMTGTNEWTFRTLTFTATTTHTILGLQQAYETCCGCGGTCSGSCDPRQDEVHVAVDWVRLEDMSYGGSCSPNPLECDGWEPVVEAVDLKLCEAAEVGTVIPDIYSCVYGNWCGDTCLWDVYDRGSWLRVDVGFCPHGAEDESCAAPSTYRLPDGDTASVSDVIAQVSLVRVYTLDGEVVPSRETEYVYDVVAGGSTYAENQLYVPAGSTRGYMYLRKPSEASVESWDRVDIHMLTGEGGVVGAPNEPIYCSP